MTNFSIIFWPYCSIYAQSTMKWLFINWIISTKKIQGKSFNFNYKLPRNANYKRQSTHIGSNEYQQRNPTFTRQIQAIDAHQFRPAITQQPPIVNHVTIALLSGRIWSRLALRSDRRVILTAHPALFSPGHLQHRQISAIFSQTSQ